jgi:capsular exopolysaccharide synthesis family protein
MESQGIKINFKEEFFKYLRFWPWIMLSVLIAFGASFFFLRYSKEEFQTTAKIQILDNSNSDFKMPSDAVSIFGTGKVNLENEVEIMKSSRIIGAVVDDLDLTTEVFSVGNIKSDEIYDNVPFRIFWAQEKEEINTKSLSFEFQITKTGYKLNNELKEYKFGVTNFDLKIPFKLDLVATNLFSKIEGKKYLIILNKKKNTTQSIARKIKIEYVGNQSEILKIALTGQNGNKISTIVNTLIDVFNNDGIKDRQLIFKKTIEFVDNRFEYLFEELDSIEKSKATFKTQHKLSYVEADAGVLMQNTQDSQTKLDNAVAQIALSKIMLLTLNKSGKFELLPPNIGFNSLETNNLVNAYNEQVLKRNKLIEAGAGEANPIIKSVTGQVNELRNNIKSTIIGYQKTLNFNKNELERISNEDKQKYGIMPSNEKSLRSIERQQSIKETLYVLLLQKREEAAINLAIINPSVKVVDYAIYESQPIGFEKTSIYLTALLIGLLLPLLIIFAYYFLDTKIHTKDDIEAVVKSFPIIAEIPFIETENKVIQFLDRSVLSESFRILRTNLNYLAPILFDKGNVLFITSTIKGEGKTFVSLNLAITLSTLGKKVILVGADLRNPQLHKTLNIDRSNSRGVTNFLVDNTVTIESLKAKNLSHNLKFDIIFSGIIPPNPAELLSNGRFELLLEDLKKEYDYVVVDTAPTLLITDTTLVTHLADAVLYVARANFTEKKLLKFIAGLKDYNNIKNIGIVLNNVGEEKSNGYGYGYSYNYNYGYGYGYDNDNFKAESAVKKITKWFLKKNN